MPFSIKEEGHKKVYLILKEKNGIHIDSKIQNR